MRRNWQWPLACLQYTREYRHATGVWTHAAVAGVCGRFAVYDLVEDGPPRNFIEAAERGDDNYIIKAIERTLDFNINQTVSLHAVGPLYWAVPCA